MPKSPPRRAPARKPAPPLPAVRLRALERTDLARSLVWVNDPEITHFTGTLFPVSEVEEEAWYQRVTTDPSWRAFAVETADGRHVGNGGFRNIQWIPRSAEAWLYIGERSQQNAGLGRAALVELLKFGFERMNLHRIWGHVFAYNERSIKMLEACGFEREGVMRDDVFRDGRYYDSYMVSVLAPR